MTFLIQSVKYLAVVLFALSIFYACSSLDILFKNEHLTAPLWYSTLTKYSGLYKFTFIVLAAYLALQQLKVAQGNYKKALDQLKFTQDDIQSKKDNEILKETLNHSKYYFTEVQSIFKELSDIGAYNGLPVKNSFLRPVTNEVLRKYESLFKSVNDSTEKYASGVGLLSFIKKRCLPPWSCVFTDHVFV